MKTSSILKAVRSVLKTEYPGYKVYLDDAVKDIETPCFVLHILDTANREGSCVLHDATLYITYLSQKGGSDTALELYDIQDFIQDKLVSGIQVGDRYIKFDRISSSKIGEDNDGIQFDLPYQYYESIDKPDNGYLIMNVNTAYSVNGDGE